jgi:hypothetical protein
MDFGPDGRLYGIPFSTGTEPTLHRIDIDDLEPSTVLPLSIDIGVPGAVVFDEDGTLLGTAFNGPRGAILFEIDPATGEISRIRSVERAAQGMGFAPSCR